MIYGIYHSRDLDGFCSGAIIKKQYPDAIMIGYDYGQPIPYEKIQRNSRVIMADVSFSMPDMVKMALYTGQQFTWIDHHKSAIDEYQKLKQDNPTQAAYITAILKQGVAACEITWSHFFTQIEMPTAVHLLGQYDTWRNENKTNWEMLVLPFQYGLKLWDIDSAETFPEGFLESYANITNVVEKGMIALSYQRIIDKANMQGSFVVDFEGLKAIACNGAGLGSMAFDSVYDEKVHDLMMPFKFDGGKWSFSLYTTKENIDCSELAKKYGGGGHKNASGFIMDKLPTFIIS